MEEIESVEKFYGCENLRVTRSEVLQLSESSIYASADFEISQNWSNLPSKLWKSKSPKICQTPNVSKVREVRSEVLVVKFLVEARSEVRGEVRHCKTFRGEIVVSEIICVYGNWIRWKKFVSEKFASGNFNLRETFSSLSVEKFVGEIIYSIKVCNLFEPEFFIHVGISFWKFTNWKEFLKLFRRRRISSSASNFSTFESLWVKKVFSGEVREERIAKIVFLPVKV